MCFMPYYYVLFMQSHPWVEEEEEEEEDTH